MLYTWGHECKKSHGRGGAREAQKISYRQIPPEWPRWDPLICNQCSPSINVVGAAVASWQEGQSCSSELETEIITTAHSTVHFHFKHALDTQHVDVQVQGMQALWHAYNALLSIVHNE
eukprot:1159049-Pelagomonas_calceolata.AAC.10